MNTDITDQSSTCRAVASSLKVVRPYMAVGSNFVAVGLHHYMQDHTPNYS